MARALVTSMVLIVAVGLCADTAFCAHHNQTPPYFPAMFVFGDSTVDPGNNNVLNTLIKANFPPYGKDFNGHIPTGRFSNGKLVTDILSSLAGLPETVPAFFDPNFKGTKIVRGVSFASSASGYYHLTCKSVNTLTLDEQVDNFRKYKTQLANVVGPNEASTIVAESVYALSTGAADFGLCYYCHPLILPLCAYCTNLRHIYTVPQFDDMLIQSLSNFLQRIVGEGARKVVVVGLPPLGCVPALITVHNMTSKSRPCVDEFNDASRSFNAKAIALLQSMETDAKVIYVDIYDKFLDMVLNPSKYGFEQARKGCCGTGLVEATYLCNEKSVVCADASKYVFFDSIHPTSATASVIAQEIARQIALKFHIRPHGNAY